MNAAATGNRLKEVIAVPEAERAKATEDRQFQPAIKELLRW